MLPTAPFARAQHREEPVGEEWKLSASNREWWPSIPAPGGECDREELRTLSEGEPGVQPVSASPGEMPLGALASVSPSVKWRWF